MSFGARCTVFSYLASPYLHKSHHIMVERFKAVAKAADELEQQGHTVISPIVYGHSMAEICAHSRRDFLAWRKLNDALLAAAQYLYILPLDGWEASAGIAYETEQARRLNKAIFKLRKEGDAWARDLMWPEPVGGKPYFPDEQRKAKPWWRWYSG